ncbi:autotransporter outer membrane beta-barrel domain-containing protein [Pseudomonas sp. RU47]|uniref:autotransporter family protein n=1 Tax=Pseudomonas sp. RU47 TaxID=2005388 RepID=UPI000FDE904B|nr:autotransporter outer membrane beta-barrel domain-containing protein [Pseudomonas sp. RU47]AZZ74207.1 autotransporter outer membrane beta-barrel domain-containing protein [Pseudomonas sp. RU47]
MNTSCLRRSLLALSVAAAVVQAPGVGAVTLNYDLGTGPLVSVKQTYDFLNLVGTANVVESSSSAMTSAARFTGLSVNSEIVNKARITIDGATHGVGIDIAPAAGVSWAQLGYNFSNEGSVTVNGLAASGESTGIALKGTPVRGTFMNSGPITVSGNNATGVALVDTSFGRGVINSGPIVVSGTNARGLYLENTALSAAVVSRSTLRATGSGAEALVLNGVQLVPASNASQYGLYNYGNVYGESIGIHVYNQPAGQGPLNIVQSYGMIEGGTAAIQVDDGLSYFYWNNGDVKGDLLGLSGVSIDGEVNFDGATIKSGYVTVQEGTLTLARAHTTIVGDLDMEEADSVIAMSVGNDTDINRAILTVTGTTEIAPGGHVQLQARSSDFRTAAGGNRYTLIRSGNLIGGENLTVESSSALLEVKSFGVEGNDVKALVSTKSQDVLTQNTLDAGGTRNAASALVGLSASLMSRLGEQDPVFQAFANASTDTQLARLAETLSPDVSRGVLHAATNSQTLVSGVINDRANRARTATGSLEKGVWLQALNSDADQDARRGVAGYDADSHGIAVGADGQLNADTSIGLAYSYLDSDVKSDIGSKTKVTGHALTAYGNWMHDNWFVDASLMYGWNDNESKRYIAGTRAKGDYDSDVFGVSALAGYTLRLTPGVVLEPQVGARYANVGMDSYREKGSSASLNVGSQRYEVGEMGVGARLSAAFAVGTGSLEPEAKLMAWHDFIGDKVGTTSSFVLGGDSFTSRGTTPVRDSYELGLGANYRMGAWSVGGSYDYVTASGFDSDGFTAKVRYAF